MKHLFCVLAVLFALSIPAAHAAPPSQAQLDELLQVMDLETSMNAMFQQMDGAAASMSKSLLPADATPQDHARMKELMQGQSERMRKLMAWDKIEPIYRKAYGEVFTAVEVQAMIDFYSTETGRSILHKTPQVLAVAMREMQPMMAQMMQDTQRALQQGMKDAPAAGAQKDAD